LADSSVAVLALPAIYRELEVDLGDLHWVLTTSNLVLALVRLRPRGSRAQHWRNHWRTTRRLALKVRRLQQFSQRCTPLPKRVRMFDSCRGHRFASGVLADEAQPSGQRHTWRRDDAKALEDRRALGLGVRIAEACQAECLERQRHLIVGLQLAR
jgi:hypothetical protein